MRGALPMAALADQSGISMVGTEPVVWVNKLAAMEVMYGLMVNQSVPPLTLANVHIQDEPYTLTVIESTGISLATFHSAVSHSQLNDNTVRHTTANHSQLYYDHIYHATANHS